MQSPKKKADGGKAGAEVFSSKVLMRCILRSYLVGAGFNTRGMQSVGFAYAMDPGLQAIYRACPEGLQAARRRYVKHYNTHPFWTPFLVGLFLGIERKIAQGFFPEKFVEHIKGTTIYTLSAIGDSFFSGSVLVFWSLATACLIVSGLGSWALAFGIACFAALQGFRAATLVYGIQEGLGYLQRLKRWNLINWGQRVKILNGVLLVAFLMLAWPEKGILWYEWLLVTVLMAASTWVVMTLNVSREIVLVIVLAAYISYPWIKALTANWI